MKMIKAFILGILEFRSNSTTHFDEPLINWYDKGRDIAHCLTFRKYDEV